MARACDNRHDRAGKGKYATGARLRARGRDLYKERHVSQPPYVQKGRGTYGSFTMAACGRRRSLHSRVYGEAKETIMTQNSTPTPNSVPGQRPALNDDEDTVAIPRMGDELDGEDELEPSKDEDKAKRKP